LSEYHVPWVKAWKESASFTEWKANHDSDYVGMINPGHPCHGHSVFGAMMSAFGKNIAPYQQNVTKSIATATTTVTEAVSTLSDPNQQEAVASLLF
jgi:GH24 family phage-related lysozyme (muramidase)